MYTQVECELEHEVTPSLTNMRELVPPKSEIPTQLIIHSIVVEYVKKYIIVQVIDISLYGWS